MNGLVWLIVNSWRQTGHHLALKDLITVCSIDILLNLIPKPCSFVLHSSFHFFMGPKSDRCLVMPCQSLRHWSLWVKIVTWISLCCSLGVQLTTFDPKTWPLPTGGSNWPFRCLDCWSFCFEIKVLIESMHSMLWARCAFGNFFKAKVLLASVEQCLKPCFWINHFFRRAKLAWNRDLGIFIQFLKNAIHDHYHHRQLKWTSIDCILFLMEALPIVLDDYVD